ncbi:MAG: preprotein translocase subunit YajC [Candidatus Latescibacterota bacterium]|jgi:preprotein translocase subunit YajC
MKTRNVRNLKLKKMGAGVCFFILNFVFHIQEAAAMGGQTGTGEQPNMLVTMLPFVLMFVVMYFLIIRPQHKKQKDQQTMIDALKKGDKVVTSGGVHGTITNVKDKEGILVVQVAKDVQIEVSRGSITKVAQAKESKK